MRPHSVFIFQHSPILNFHGQLGQTDADRLCPRANRSCSGLLDDLATTRPQAKQVTVVCYDIADDRRRREIARTLEGYGTRVQESVFECWLMPAQRRELEARLDGLVHAVDDRVAFYTLSPNDAAATIVMGSDECLADNPDAFFV